MIAVTNVASVSQGVIQEGTGNTLFQVIISPAQASACELTVDGAAACVLPVIYVFAESFPANTMKFQLQETCGPDVGAGEEGGGGGLQLSLLLFT